MQEKRKGNLGIKNKFVDCWRHLRYKIGII
jgi:hypothetical protein